MADHRNEVNKSRLLAVVSRKLTDKTGHLMTSVNSQNAIYIQLNSENAPEQSLESGIANTGAISKKPRALTGRSILRITAAIKRILFGRSRDGAIQDTF
jgi:hypothetical protein